VNDTPKDFATYEFAITVPEGKTALANGRLVSKTNNGDTTTWRWRESSPMVPYLTTATNGVFELRIGKVNGLPEYNAVDPQTRRFGQKEPNPELAFERLALNEPAIDLFNELYGRYPYDSVGGIVDWADNVFYSLESQTKPNYWHLPSEDTVVHEIAHQWFGDAVVLERWPDMWLNEGFATWSEWIWSERRSGQTAQERFNQLYAIQEDTAAGQDLWFPAPNGLADASELFHTPVYDRGAMTLQALRQKLGWATFLQIVRTWYAENKFSNVTTQDFIAVSERVSGRQLDRFFDVWLFEEGRPEPGSW
jgi:aminopeptidase N